MADDEVVVHISANDMASDKIRAVGDTVKKTGEAGRLGFFALGEAAENAAEKMGVPNQVSRQLGNSVERMASSLGTAGMALGAVGLAASSAVIIWKKYRDEQILIREEKIKAAQASAAWITGILTESANTRDLVAAKREMAKAEFDINKARAEAAVPELLAKQAELQAKYTLELKRSNGEAFIWLGSWEDAKKKAEGFRLELGMVNAQVKANDAALKLYSAENRDKVGGIKAGKTSEETNAEKLAATLDQIEYKKAQNIIQLRDMLAADNVRRYEEEQRINQMREQGAITMASNMAQTAQLMSQLNTSSARKWFSIYKVAAIGETVMTTARAAMAAFAPPPLGLGPVFGGALAGTIAALGAAKVALIRSQTFDGGGGGAVGTYSANAATGLPNVGGSSSGPRSIAININGQKVGEYELASGVARTFYNNNGSVDGFTLAVERSA